MPNTYPKILKAGSYANYIALPSKDVNVLYFCTDNGKLFKGEVDFTNAFVDVTSSALPVTGVPGKIYRETDTGIFKMWNGSAYQALGTPTDASDDSGATPETTITASSDNGHVPTSKNVYLYGQDILAQATGGSSVVKSVAAGDSAAEIVVTKGDNSEVEVVVPAVITGVDQKANTPGTLVVTSSSSATAYSAEATYDEGDLVTYNGYIYKAKADIETAEEWTAAHWDLVGQASADVVLAGVTYSPEWDSVTRTLTFGVAGSQNAFEVQFDKDIFLDPEGNNHYDENTQELVLYLNTGSGGVKAYDETETYEIGDQVHHDDHVYEALVDISVPEEWTAAHWNSIGEYVAPTEVRIPVAGLIPIYSGGDTTTAKVAVNNKVITTTVKVDAHSGNAITIEPDTGEGAEKVEGGLRVDLSSYATTAALGLVEDKADANAAEILAIYQAWGWDSFDPAQEPEPEEPEGE